MIKKIEILLLLLFFVTTAFSQKDQFKRSMLEYNKHLASIKNASLEIEYLMYLDKSMTKPFSSKSFFVYQENKKVYAKDKNEVEYYSNDTALIIADLVHKYIMISSKERKNLINFTEFNSFLEMNFDTITKAYDSIICKNINENIVLYHCTFKNKSPYDKISITYNRKKNLVEKVMFFYHKKMVIDQNKPKELHFVTIEINYKNYDFSFKNIDRIKNISNFISSSNGKIVLVGNYKTFKLSNEYYEKN